MHIISVDKQKLDELSDTASGTHSHDLDTEALLADVPSRSETEEETLKATSTSYDQEAWYQQPKEECLRY